GVGGVARPVGIVAHHLLVHRGGILTGVGHRVNLIGQGPELGPAVLVAVGGEDRVAGLRIDLDDVVIAGVAAVVGGGVIGLGSFGGVVDAPVLAVDVQLIHVAALGVVTH